MRPPKDPCKPRACDIQACLKANDYQEHRCQTVINAMKRCCEKYGENSLVCDGFMKNIKADKDKQK